MRGGFERRARRDGIVSHSGFGPRGVSFRRSSLERNASAPALQIESRRSAEKAPAGVALPDAPAKGARARARALGASREREQLRGGVRNAIRGAVEGARTWQMSHMGFATGGLSATRSCLATTGLAV